MGRIPRDVVDAVRDRTDLIELVSRHVKLVRRGSSMVGLCPFHQEKSPSFNVVPAKRIYHCFGCQEGGDCFDFLMKYEGITFIEAVKELAGPAGIEVPERELTANELQKLRARASLYELMEDAAAWFEKTLWTSSQAGSARQYLDDRGMEKDTVRTARLGYAPPGWSNLSDHLQQLGYPMERLVEAGMVRARQSGNGHYDTFRERLIVPIRDVRGRVIAFGGRILEGDGPKYINSPETRLYTKSQVLYGLDMARASIQRRDRVIVTEGYFDVLSLHQAGFTEAIATCGTALTQDHLEVLRRMTRNAIVLFDADKAGSNAAEKALPMFVSAGIHSWRLQLPDAKDPDDLIREQGPEAMQDALENRREPLVEWMVDRKLAQYGRDAMGRDRIVEEVADWLRHLPDTVISDVSRRIGVREELVRSRIRTARQAAPLDHADHPPPPPPHQGWRPNRDQVHVLWLLVHRYDQVADLIERLAPDFFEGQGPMQRTVKALQAGRPAAALLHEVDDPGMKRTLFSITARTELYEPDHAAIGMCQVLARMSLPSHQAQLAQTDALVRDAQRDGDVEALAEAAGFRAAIVSRKQSLERALKARDAAAAIALLAQTPE